MNHSFVYSFLKRSPSLYKSRNRTLFKELRNSLNKEIRLAKKIYSEKLKNQFQAERLSLWRGFQSITNYNKPFPAAEANLGLAIDRNTF